MNNLPTLGPIVSVGICNGGYWVVFDIGGGKFCGECWPICPKGWEDKVDRY